MKRVLAVIFFRFFEIEGNLDFAGSPMVQQMVKEHMDFISDIISVDN
jgi:hypothetical protein